MTAHAATDGLRNAAAGGGLVAALVGAQRARQRGALGDELVERQTVEVVGLHARMVPAARLERYAAGRAVCATSRGSHTGRMPSRVILFSTDSCTYCEHAKSLLSKRGVSFEEVNLSEHPELQSELAEVTGLESFPQILVNGEPLGGLNELRAAEKNGVLASWSAA